MPDLILVGLISFVVALLLTPLCRNAALRVGFVDLPDGDRKLHTKPIPRIGGIPIALAYLVGVLALCSILPQASRPDYLGGNVFSAVLPAAAVILCTGLLDDLIGLRPWHKLVGQIVAAVMVCRSDLFILEVTGSAHHWWSVLLAVLWLVGCTNAFNLIDGVDGLACGLGLLGTLTVFITALVHGHTGLVFVTVPLVGALLGFLVYNFNPASIFLGDSGSLTLGFVLGCYALIWSQKSATMLGMAAPVMAMAVPLFDVGVSILRRFLRNIPVFRPDRGHIHHRLLARGFTPRAVALILYCVCGFGAMFSLLLNSFHRQFGGLIVVLFCAAAFSGVRMLGYIEFGALQKILLGGNFRKAVSHEICLRDLRASLKASKSVEHEWAALADACRKLGVEHVTMRCKGREFSAEFAQLDPSHRWSFEIHFSQGESISLRGDLRTQENIPLVPLIAIVKQQRLSLPKARRSSSTSLLPPEHPTWKSASVSQEVAS